jgi:hypothetical protein
LSAAAERRPSDSAVDRAPDCSIAVRVTPFFSRRDSKPACSTFDRSRSCWILHHIDHITLNITYLITYHINLQLPVSGPSPLTDWPRIKLCVHSCLVDSAPKHQDASRTHYDRVVGSAHIFQVQHNADWHIHTQLKTSGKFA